jgi:ABC-type uncharacterized transport system ATPase subunit
VASASVRLEHVTRTFGDALAVDDVSFEVQPGEFLTMLALVAAERRPS